jgi:hypothetical protein
MPLPTRPSLFLHAPTPVHRDWFMSKTYPECIHCSPSPPPSPKQKHLISQPFVLALCSSWHAMGKASCFSSDLSSHEPSSLTTLFAGLVLRFSFSRHCSLSPKTTCYHLIFIWWFYYYPAFTREYKLQDTEDFFLATVSSDSKRAPGTKYTLWTYKHSSFRCWGNSSDE